jgi:hypothetical protein
MVLSDEDITKFQLLYKKRFGIELNKKDAYEKGIKLLSLLKSTYRPMTKDEFATIQQHRKATVVLLEQSFKKP